MNCNCSVDDWDVPNLFHRSIRKAKLEHYCCECGERISPNDFYEKVIGKWDRDFVSFSTCMTCKRIRDDYCPDGSYFGELVDIMFDCLGFNYLEKEA